MSKNNTIHLTYWVEYQDSEDRYDEFFKIHHTIFRNVPLSQLKRLNLWRISKCSNYCSKNHILNKVS